MADVPSHYAISFIPEGCASPPIIGLRRQPGVKASSRGHGGLKSRCRAGVLGGVSQAAGPATGKTLTWSVVHGTARRVRHRWVEGLDSQSPERRWAGPLRNLDSR